MTHVPTASPDSVDQRQRRMVAAVVRGAYAWSHRSHHPAALRELARMTGVVMETIGPGGGPTAPMQLVEYLRRPVGDLLSLVGPADDAIAEVVFLDGADALSSTAYDVAGEYAYQLNDPSDTAGWLPSWTRMRSEQIRQTIFARLVESGSQADYVNARRLLIEHPAGDRIDLSRLVANGARCAADYRDIPPEQRHQHDGRVWWWPCPRCRWPMVVTEDLVRCPYRPHRASYRLAAYRGSARSAPRLLRIRDDAPSPPRARAAEHAVCVDTAAWRSVVVPGTTELRIAAVLTKLGATTLLWPDLDAYDLHVTAGTSTWRFDVKEYRSLRRLINDLRDKPPGATVLLPVTHEHQRDALAAAVPSVAVVTETQARRMVRKALREVS